MWKTYVKIAFRNLSKSKLFTAINVTGLSIGMAAALLIFVWVQNELSFDNYHKDSDRIYRMISNLEWGDEIRHWATVPLSLTIKAAEEIPEIEIVTKVRHLFGKPILKTENGTLFKEENLAYVDEKWLEVFDYKIVEGNLATFQNNINSIAFTASKAEQLFGYKSAVGQTVIMDSVIYSVDLILADNPTNSVLQFEGFIPLKARLSNEKNLKNDQSWGDFAYFTFIKCKEGVQPQIVEEKLLAILDKYKTRKDRKNDTSITLEPLEAIRFSETITSEFYEHQNKSAVYIFALIGLILLLSASFNYVNLSTALVNKRVKEIGVKKIIGASFRHIFSQVMMETFLISLIAVLLSIGLAQFALPFLQQITGLALTINLDSQQIWLIIGGLLLTNILIAGVYPAILFSNFKPIRLVKEKAQSPQGISLRKGLVIAQFVVATVMLISTIIVYDQLTFIQQKNVGYDRSYVLDISPNLFTGDWMANFKKFTLFEKELRQIPAFEATALSSGSLVNIKSSNSGNFKWDGQAEEEEAPVFTLNADERLINIFDLQMVSGRWFQTDLKADKNNYILNEAAILKFDIPEPVIGAKVAFRGSEGVIIGITKDFHFKSLHQTIDPLLISYNNKFTTNILAKINGKTGQEALLQAKEKFATHFPNIPFEYTFLDDTFEKMHESEAKMTLLLQIFACLLIFISCLGLFGLATFAVERRTKEIGIRKVLGASSQLIVQLLSKDFLKLVLIALIIAIPISWNVMQNWLENYPYRIEMDWWIFAMVGVLTMSIAFLTVGIQGIKAALMNPAKVLKSE